MNHKGELRVVRYTTFLIENLTMLLVLLVAIIITLTGFLKATNYKVQVKEQLEANLIAQILLEYGKATQLDYTQVLGELRASKLGDSYYFYYDKEWVFTESIDEAAYIAELEISDDILESKKLKNLQVNVYKENVKSKNIIYSLSGKAY